MGKRPKEGTPPASPLWHMGADNVYQKRSQDRGGMLLGSNSGANASSGLSEGRATVRAFAWPWA